MRNRVVRAATSRWVLTSFFAACGIGMMAHFGVGCSGWDPTHPFERNSPDVDRALEMLDAGELESAEDVLSEYLGTGICKNGEIGLPDTVRQRPDGTFDLGLVLFYMAERYGRRFGDEEKGDPALDQPGAPAEPGEEKRDHGVRCALIVTAAIASDPSVPPDLRARAYYLAGNLEFMRRRYMEAIRFYDQALAIIPGVIEEAGGDGIGRDAAYNRAVALRRLEKLNDAGPDAPEDAPADSPEDAPPEAGPDAPDDAEPQGPDGGQDGGGDDAGDDGGDDAGDAGSDQSGDAGDAGQDAGDDDPNGDPQDDPKDPPNQPSEPNPSEQEFDDQQGDRILDRFEQVPTYQQEESKKKGEGRQRRMEDK